MFLVKSNDFFWYIINYVCQKGKGQRRGLQAPEMNSGDSPSARGKGNEKK